ncbi:MBL fold metallo-hydrolase [Pseudomonas songnenensis]|uniref:MBL fold metallo-hydrolase n=1 Tax=Pseudomonas songnenensis TaxID=1176259 RepID=A0ABX9UYS2_9PSED|nr:MBL fold metallo-hydrolase RNA specificity domain-containing protein [Pseudomonas songnenensis]MCQ4299677.1 MBL fold metallo-hydrolase [Pseudomonas songnenensis]RMH98282.1 MBL fold metallo-hydrolase [Pseudomonas songnenensis]
MLFPRITHYGSTTGVTGSCHQLHADAVNSYLIDCGLFQGGDTANEGQTGQDSLGIAFPIDTIRTLGENKRVVFFGDLGAPHAPMLPAPKAPCRADILVIESPYGDRQHEDRRTRRQRLEHVVGQVLQDGGTVVIPAFSNGRTQELLYELEDIIHRAQTKSAASLRDRVEVSWPDGAQASGLKKNWPELPIILDSPLANRFTAAYRELKPFWNQEAIKRVQSGRRPLGFEQLLTVDSHAEHLRMVGYLARSARPEIVIAGNGMCSSGRIVNYLKAMLGAQRHNVLFVGYQAAGTPGQAIQSFGPKGGYVDLDGERLAIKAGVTTIGGYSAHADQDGLVRFVTSMRRRPSHIRIVHGESKAKQALAARLAAIYQDKQQPLQLEIPQ